MLGAPNFFYVTIDILNRSKTWFHLRVKDRSASSGPVRLSSPGPRRRRGLGLCFFCLGLTGFPVRVFGFRVDHEFNNLASGLTSRWVLQKVVYLLLSSARIFTRVYETDIPFNPTLPVHPHILLRASLPASGNELLLEAFISSSLILEG